MGLVALRGKKVFRNITSDTEGFSGLDGLGATILTSSAATAYNAKSSTKRGWKIKAGGPYKSVNDPKLASDVYCFQHQVEACMGTCTPNDKAQDCYNRDGMIGDRTLQEIANAILSGDPQFGTKFKQGLSLPSFYMNAGVKAPPPASDVRSDVAAGVGAAGKKHKEELKKVEKDKSASSKLPSKPKPTKSWLKDKKKLALVGIGSVGAIGAIAYMAYNFIASKEDGELGATETLEELVGNLPTGWYIAGLRHKGVFESRLIGKSCKAAFDRIKNNKTGEVWQTTAAGPVPMESCGVQ